MALSAFFAFGTLAAGLSCIALLTPGGLLEPIWQLNPRAQLAFRSMGPWSIALLFIVATACALSAIGVWIRARWGHRLALAMLCLDFLADAITALVRGEWHTLIGLPIAGALVAYLLSAAVRRQFATAREAG
jgi:hypothetical protein